MKKKIIIISSIILLIALITTSIYFIFYNPFLDIKLKGKKKITLEVNKEYKEPGIITSGTKNKYKVSGKVNTKKLGTYTLIYKIKFLKTEKEIKREITIVDTTKPELKLTKGNISIYQNETFKDPGYEVTDNYDENTKVEVTGKVDTKKVGEYKLTYTATDSSNNVTTAERKVTVKKKEVKTTSGLTYINGILLVNKKYSVPSTYNPGINSTAQGALTKLQNAANKAGHKMPLVSGFRSYSRQKTIYNNYVAIDGVAKADTYSARPGHSEHQTGLAFDVGAIDDNYGNTAAGKWLANNAHKYGFIIRYPKGKTHITGYKYEPWHIRYIGTNHATTIYNKQITLEEYLNVA